MLVPLWVWKWRVSRLVGTLRSRTVRSMSASVLISIFALAVSGATFYRNFVYVQRDARFTPAGLSALEDGAMTTLVAVNPGNRPIAVLSADLMCWRFSMWQPIANNPSTSDFSPLVIKPGEVVSVMVKAAFDWNGLDDRCEARVVGGPPAIRTDSYLYIGLLTHVVTDDGLEFRNYHLIGSFLYEAFDNGHVFAIGEPVGEQFSVLEPSGPDFGEDEVAAYEAMLRNSARYFPGRTRP